jgi:hypothetical protein
MIVAAVLVVAGGFMAFDAFRPAPVEHALMNAEGIVALSFLALLYVRGEASNPTGPMRIYLLPLAAIVAVIALAFTPILHTLFLYDDYTHITDASRSTWLSIAQFGRVPGQGLFFRPIGFLLCQLNYVWAGANPALWHASNIALHAICSCLTYVLCCEIGFSWPASLGGALLFGLSGVSAEPVAWVDAGFVVLTTAMVLLSLIFVCRYALTGRTLWLAGALATGACAMLSKETAFCLPLLIATLALFQKREDWPRIGRATIFVSLLTAVLFAYRWWALQGLGGYAGSIGAVDILHFNLLRTVNAVFLRQWAVLFFPFNWSNAGPLLRPVLAAIPFILAVYAWLARPPRRALAGCVLFILAAALPVEHLLLLSPDLGGSRTLYLGSVGWALLLAFVFESMPRPIRIASACVLVALQAMMLEHNLAVWRETSKFAQSVCIDFGRRIAGSSEPVAVQGLPMIRNGAVFLQNGFPQCVEMNTGVPAARIQMHSVAGAKQFFWNEAHGRIEQAGPR